MAKATKARARVTAAPAKAKAEATRPALAINATAALDALKRLKTTVESRAERARGAERVGYERMTADVGEVIELTGHILDDCKTVDRG